MIPKDGIDLPYVKAALERRLWYVVVPFFAISLAAVIYCIVVPRAYTATTVILVEQQKVPSDYVRSTVTMNLGARLRTIQQQVKSRTRLEGIIGQYGLYDDILASGTMTDAVETFRDNIRVNVRGGGSAFEVSFRGKNPETVRDVTDALANLFIEDNLRLRESQATGTTRFLDRELERLETELQDNETAVREFKVKYSGFLPDDMRQNETIMSHLEKQLYSINDTIEQNKDRKVVLETQLKNLERMQAQLGYLQGGEGQLREGLDQASGTPENWTSPAVEELRGELKKLKTRYSEKHPDVIRLQASLTRLEEEQEIGEEFSLDASEGASLIEAQEEDVNAQLQVISEELNDLQKEKREIKGDMEIYRHRIETGPKIQQMLTDITRSYRGIKDNYDALLQKKFRAQVAENLERAQQAEQFSVVDPAKLPDKPSKPQTRKILVLAFCLALATGLGGALLKEYLDPSFFRAKDLEDGLLIPVLVSIPLITTQRDHRGIIVKKVLSATAMVSMASILLYALYFLWKMDPMLHTSPLG